MTINERIKKIGEYFKGFNIANETSFVFVKFPDTWSTFDETELNTKFNVYTGKKDGGIYFITETENGVDCLFDAIEYLIDANKALEEKTALLQIKAKELTDLFLSEPLEKLKTLQFTFTYKEPVKRAKKIQIKEPKENVLEVNKDEKLNLSEEVKPIETPIITSVEEKIEKTTTKKNKKDSDAMSFVKSLTKTKKK